MSLSQNRNIEAYQADLARGDYNVLTDGTMIAYLAGRKIAHGSTLELIMESMKAFAHRDEAVMLFTLELPKVSHQPTRFFPKSR